MLQLYQGISSSLVFSSFACSSSSFRCLASLSAPLIVVRLAVGNILGRITMFLKLINALRLAATGAYLGAGGSFTSHSDDDGNNWYDDTGEKERNREGFVVVTG